jgi:SAM-dependent methyltransferase
VKKFNEKNVIYHGRIRAGKPGQLTKNNFSIIYDAKWQFAKLEPIQKINYSDKYYRNLVNNSATINNYFAQHDKQQLGYLKFILPHMNRGDIVADFGCGGATNLDCLKGLSKLTIAIEPFEGFRSSLESRGHKYFPSTKSLLKYYTQKVNLGLSLHVIEHTLDPIKYLQGIYDALVPRGKLILITPNLDDILLKLNPEFYKPFFFRKVHNYYFTGKSLELLGRHIGFRASKMFYYNEFGIGNTFYWLLNSTAKGDVKYPYINEKIDLDWIKFLEDSGQAYNVGAIFEK